MEMITYSQVQELLRRVPVAKLPLAYTLLAELADDEVEALSPQREFMLLPFEERQRILAQQAQELVAHYEQTAAEREEWQAGDFWDEG
jgi:hypothetical protein